jgi:MFS family permease
MSDNAPAAAPRETEAQEIGSVSVFTGAVRRYLLARFCVAAAFQIQSVAVGWYIYALTDSALDLGFVGLAMFLPQAGLALIAGQVIDRFERRHVLLTAWTLQAGASSVIALLALLDLHRVDLIYILISCFGAGRAFEQPAQATMLPSLVPVPLLPRVTPANSLMNQSAVVIGPTLGGLLFIFGAPVAFLGTVTMLAIGIAAVSSLPRTPPRPAQPLSWESFLGGISFIRRVEAVRGAITLDMFGVLFGGGATTLLPIFARDIFAIGPIGLGLMRSAPAIGALASGLFLARHPLERRVGRRMFGAVAVFGVATIVFGLSHWLILSFAALIALGAADVISVVVRSTLVQTATPDNIRGRVSAVNSLFVGTSNQLGAFESGLMAEWLGAVSAVALGGVVTLLVVVAASRYFPALRRMDRFVMAPGTE